jgi:hypothetical protein
MQRSAVPHCTTGDWPRVSILAPADGFAHRPPWQMRLTLHPIPCAGGQKQASTEGDPMINRTSTARPAGIPADKSMQALEYVVALCAMAAAFVIGLVR